MLERDERKSGEEMKENTGVREVLADGWFTALRERLVGTGEDVRLQGRRPILLAALLVAVGAWFFVEGTEPEEGAFVAPPSAAVSQAPLREDVTGTKEAQNKKALADPFALLHGEEQATVAAMAAVGGGDERCAAALNRATDKSGSDSSAGGRQNEKTAASPNGVAVGKTASAAVPQVRGTVTSNVGTVLLLSVGGHDFFLAEGEEKEGVLLQSLSDKSAVVVVGGKSYTLNLPG